MSGLRKRHQWTEANPIGFELSTTHLCSVLNSYGLEDRLAILGTDPADCRDT